MNETPAPATASGARYAVVELMGHATHIGLLTEVDMFGSKLGQVEALQPDGTTVTVHFGGGAVYRITATTEEAAKEMVKPRVYNALPYRSEWCPICDERLDDCTCRSEVYEEDNPAPIPLQAMDSVPEVAANGR